MKSHIGLHDGPLGNATVPGQAGLPNVYSSQLEQITAKLKLTLPNTKFLFALTSPSLCDPIGDGCVVNLNNQASKIMEKYDIPTINPHTAIINECGPAPQIECWNVTKCFCPHCARGGENEGYDWLAKTLIVPALKNLLQ